MDESYATVWEVVADAIPDALAVVQGTRRITHGELEQRATRLAGALAAMGVRQGTHVALYLFNCPEYLECLLACSKLRAVPVNVNYRYLGDELAFLVDNADAEVLVFPASLGATVADARGRMPQVHTSIVVDDTGTGGSDSWDSDDTDSDAYEYEKLIADHEPVARRERSGDDLLLWYTGGTTGLPKGVLWRQGTLLDYGLATTALLQGETAPGTLDDLAAAVRRWHHDGTSVGALLTTPLIHATAAHQANSALSGGATITLLERGPIQGDAICGAIAQHRPRVLEVVGDTVVRRIVRALDAAEARDDPYDLSSLQRVHNSGAMVSAPLKDALLSRGTMHFYDSLGSTEAVGFGFARTNDPGDSATARFTLGPNARLLTAELRDIAPGSSEAGVLAVRRSCGLGYYKDPDLTARAFPEIDGERHAMPGDWATLGADRTLTLLGRGSGCINSGGEKVWPEEVEEVLKEHASVTDAVVLGIADEEWGEIIGAVVAPTDGAHPSAEDLTSWVGTRLAGYKRPRRIVFRSEVRRTPIGKVDYAWARAALDA